MATCGVMEEVSNNPCDLTGEAVFDTEKSEVFFDSSSDSDFKLFSVGNEDSVH